MRRIFFAVLALCLSTLVACQRDDIMSVEPPAESTNKISFTTRGAVIDDSNINAMTMFCYETGVEDFDATKHSANHIYGAKVSREKSGGTYYDWTISPQAPPFLLDIPTPDSYWSQGNKHSFLAIAPFDIVLENFQPQITSNPLVEDLASFNYAIPDKMADHKDLIYAITLNQLDNFANLEPSKRSVDLYFKHALSKVQFTAQRATGVVLPAGEKFRIAGIALNGIKGGGKFSFKKIASTTATIEGEANSSSDYIDWDLAGVSDINPVWTETDLTYLDDDFITDLDPETKKINIIAGGNALFMIPQTFDAPRTLRLSYVHHTQDVPEGILKEYEMTLPMNAWEAGKSITYNLKFDPKSGTSPWAVEADIKDWDDVQTSVSASEAYFTLSDGKRSYAWSEAVGSTSAPRTFTIPFETNVALSDIAVSANGNVVKSEVNKTIIYTESGIESNDRDIITVSMRLRDGDGEAAQIVTRNITIRIGGYEIIEQDGKYGAAIEKNNYYYSRYSTKSQMYYAEYDMPTQASSNDLTWTKTTQGYELDFCFEIYQLNEGQGTIEDAKPTLTLPDGIEIIDGGDGYDKPGEWNTSFGEKRLRLRISHEMVGIATLKIGGTNEHQLSFSVLDGAIVTDYTDQKFVEDLTGLSNGYGGVTGLRVSNSYITSPHSDYATIFYIPIRDRVNEFWSDHSGVSNPQDYTIVDEAWTYNKDYSVELSWYDGANSGTNPPITDLQVSKNFSPASNLSEAQNAILVVQPKGFEEQNYVINVKKGDVIIWSIHCWATKYNPYRNAAYTAAPARTTVNEVISVVGGEVHSYDDAPSAATPIWVSGAIYGSKFIMDRNLGAFGADFAGHGSVNSNSVMNKGVLYFQYGRKDPSPRFANYANSYSYSQSREKVTFAKAVNNPYIFYYDYPIYNWSSESVAQQIDILWYDKNFPLEGYSAGKSIFDPSPLGFRVPIKGTWDNFTLSNTINGTGVYQTGRIYNGLAYYPFCGYRQTNVDQASNKNVDFSGSITYIRSLTPREDSDINYHAYTISLSPSVVLTTSTYSRSAGFTVRSIQE